MTSNSQSPDRAMLQPVFASRTLSGPSGDVTLRIYCPQKVELSWYAKCVLFDHEGVPVWSSNCGGVDSVQALELALFCSRARINTDESGFQFLETPGSGIMEMVMPPEWLVDPSE